MTEPGGRTGDPHLEAIAQVRREFAQGLPERVAAIRAALKTLQGGFDAAAAQTFFLKTHSLKGTAAAFGATDVSTHASTLTELGRRWVKTGEAPGDQVAEAAPAVDRLAAAIDHYCASVDADGAP